MSKGTIIYGLQGTGKTTKSKILLNDWIVNNPQFTRENILEFSGEDLLENMAEKLCKSGTNLIYVDACVSVEMLYVITSYCVSYDLDYIINIQMKHGLGYYDKRTIHINTNFIEMEKVPCCKGFIYQEHDLPF
jgi:hypothetical protein